MCPPLPYENDLKREKMDAIIYYHDLPDRCSN